MATTSAPAEAVTPTAMLAEVRAAKSAATAADNRLLVLAAEWADAHPVLGEDPEPVPARGRDPLDPFEERAGVRRRARDPAVVVEGCGVVRGRGRPVHLRWGRDDPRRARAAPPPPPDLDPGHGL